MKIAAVAIFKIFGRSLFESEVNMLRLSARIFARSIFSACCSCRRSEPDWHYHRVNAVVAAAVTGGSFLIGKGSACVSRANLRVSRRFLSRGETPRFAPETGALPLTIACHKLGFLDQIGELVEE